MTSTVPSRPEYFRTPKDLADWFEANPSASELWVGLWKKGFERPGISYGDAVDEALCNGWIDSVVRRVDEASYMVRFTPRRPRSNWTDANLSASGGVARRGGACGAASGRAAVASTAPKALSAPYTRPSMATTVRVPGRFAG